MNKHIAATMPCSIVLVHGAFVDASGWKAVHAQLSAQGYEVLVVQNPTISLAGDVAATGRVIGMARHPVILVGHSYGGAVITEAGMHPQVSALVYIAAFVPDAGESVASLTAHPEPGAPAAPILPPQDGFLVIDPAGFAQAFAADVDADETRFMAAAQAPWGLEAVTGVVNRPAWKSKPSHYLVAASDRMIPPAAQRRMVARAGARVLEVDCSHAAMLARPDEVAALIAAAAVASTHADIAVY